MREVREGRAAPVAVGGSAGSGDSASAYTSPHGLQPYILLHRTLHLLLSARPSGTVLPREPFMGISCSASATSGSSPSTRAAVFASSADMAACPSSTAVTHTLCLPTALAMDSTVSLFACLAARIFSVACARVSMMHSSSG